MDSEALRKQGRDMLDYVAKYWDTICERGPVHGVEPGYLRQLIPDRPPDKPEDWDKVLQDIERVIMPGITHWHSPQFHGYYPTPCTYPSILGDILSDGLGGLGFNWSTSPAYTELEVNMMDWMAKMLQLPSQFLFNQGKGGGIIQPSASDCILVSLLSARAEMSNRLKKDDPSITKGQIIDKLVAYTSEMANSSVERAGLLGFVQTRNLPTDDNYALRGSTLDSAMTVDIANGLVPFFVCATVGTTGVCSFDNLQEIGNVCKKHKVWFHIDAAYAGSASICPEYRHLINGVELCTTFSFNPHKWMAVNHDCAAMWVNDTSLLSDAFVVDPVYLKDKDKPEMPDYRHWQTSLSRRFRSIKVWLVLRLLGVEALKERIRKDIKLAKHFEALVRKDRRFEIVGEVVLGLVCFRIKGSNPINEKLYDAICTDRRIVLTPAKIKDKYSLRFVVCAEKTTEKDVQFAWSVITELTDHLINGVHINGLSIWRL